MKWIKYKQLLVLMLPITWFVVHYEYKIRLMRRDERGKFPSSKRLHLGRLISTKTF